MKPGRHFVRLLVACLFMLPNFIPAAETNSAKLEISGYGLLGNRKLKNMLKLLDVGGKKPEFYDATFIEDAAVILRSGVMADGHLQPEIRARLILENNEKTLLELDEKLTNPVPRPLRARRARFEIDPGILYYYGLIQFEGLTAISDDDARAFFIENGPLVKFKQHKIYTPGRLERGLSSLTEVLARKGYENAEATATNLVRNDRTGEIRVTIAVKEGRKSIVRSIREETSLGKTKEPGEIVIYSTNAPYSKLWQQDFVHALKATNYHRGYPDTTVDITTIRRVAEAEGESDFLDLQAKVDTGPQVKLGEIRFEGQERTKLSVLRRRVRYEGSLLDRIQAEQGRYRLARLGIFDSVELRYDQRDEETRDIVYQLDEGKEVDVSMLLGYGSYELVRGGFEVEQYNVFGRAHHARLRVVQSLKSSSAEYVYTMPELVGRDVDIFFNSSGLRREEISFTREEFGGGIGARKHFPSIQSELSTRYNYQILSAVNADIDLSEGVQSAAVGAFIFDFKHDRRDHPLYPREGYKVFGNLEVASEYVASEVNYQRFEFGASYHRPIQKRNWIHLGVNHGFVFTDSGPSLDLPFNKRFFPGGENSVRGYQQGEAAPRNAKGQIVGAETYLSANFELEQALTDKWSIVGFLDSIGFARQIANYPFDETLFSAGGGIRWKTPIGPVRLEYGHNLNPRQGDPSGTLHFSIGFPF